MCQTLSARKGWGRGNKKVLWCLVVVADSLRSPPLATSIILFDAILLMHCEMHCSRSELLFELLPYSRAQVLGLACLIITYSLSCIKFSACRDTKTWPFQFMCLCKKRRKNRVRCNLVLTQLCPPASNHLRLSLSASLEILLVALAY